MDQLQLDPRARQEFLARFAADHPGANLALVEGFLDSCSGTNTGHESFDSDDPEIKQHNRRAAMEDLRQLKAVLPEQKNAIRTARAVLVTYADDPAVAERARAEVRRLDALRCVKSNMHSARTIGLPVTAARRQPRPRRRKAPARRESGGDDPPGGPGEPGERLCDCGCGRSIAHKKANARAFSPACRKRIERHGPAEAPKQRDPYLWITVADLEALTRRAREACRCNGTHILDPSDGACLKCGHTHDRGISRRTSGDRLVQARSLECQQGRLAEFAA